MKIEKVKSSNLARVMECAGVLFFTDLPKSTHGDEAKEGTAFGELVELNLTGQPITTHAKNGVPFDSDMKFYSKDIVEEVLTKSYHGNREINCEKRVDWQTRSGIWIKGAYDVSFTVGDTLYVDDIKYGWSLVEAEKNWQLLSYAIGEVIRQNINFKTIVLRIHQPRPHHEDGDTRQWVLSYGELLKYKELIELRMEEIAAGNNDLVSSKNCKYCQAATKCPAFGKAYFRSVDEIHNFIQDNISDEELSFQLDLYDRMKEIFKVRKDSLEQLAIDRLNNGGIIPNYVTKQGMSNRAWSPGTDADLIKMLTNIDISKTGTLSPAQAEKAGVSKDLVKSLTSRYPKPPTLKRADTTKEANEIFGDPNAE